MFTVRLEEIQELSASTREFRFVREDGKSLDYKPGQFYRFVFADSAGEFERSYSLCNFETLYSDRLDLLISKVEAGRATRLLFSAEPGLTASVTGPFGRLTLPETMPDRLVLVATSVGLAPYLPILKQLESAGDQSVVLLLGVRDRSEFIHGERLLDYAKRFPNFELRLSLSRESGSEPYEHDGYVTTQLEEMTIDPARDHFLLCGNPKMVDDCYAVLKAAGCRPKQVVREKYVFAREAKVATKTLTDEQKRLIAEKMKRHS